MKNELQEQKVMHALNLIGVPQHFLGYEYITTGVQLVQEDRGYLHNITKMLYPEIARKHITSVARVERAIRHAIETAFDNIPLELMHDIFGNTVSASKGKPTNSHFIGAVANYVRNDR